MLAKLSFSPLPGGDWGKLLLLLLLLFRLIVRLTQTCETFRSAVLSHRFKKLTDCEADGLLALMTLMVKSGAWKHEMAHWRVLQIVHLGSRGESDLIPSGPDHQELIGKRIDYRTLSSHGCSSQDAKSVGIRKLWGGE